MCPVLLERLIKIVLCQPEKNSHLNQKIHAAKHKLKKTAIAHIVKTNEVNTGSPSNRVRLDSDK